MKVDVHCREVSEEIMHGVVTVVTVVNVVVVDLCIIMQFNNDKAIVDSGTTDIYLATDAFEAVLNAFLEYMQVS